MADHKVIKLFIKEEKNILSFFAENNISLSQPLIDNLVKISTRVNNNYIGYYQFKINDIYYKIFIVPKIFENGTEIEKEANFVNLLRKYYDIQRTYKSASKEIKGNIIDYSFNGSGISSGMQLQDFNENKFKDALIFLDRFFRKHRRIERRNISYKSQSINQTFDVTRASAKTIVVKSADHLGPLASIDTDIFIP